MARSWFILYVKDQEESTTFYHLVFDRDGHVLAFADNRS